MTTKKEILDCVKSIADHQDLIATKQNTERKAEAITTQTLLAEILRELRSIKNILEDAAKEPTEGIRDNLEEIPSNVDLDAEIEKELRTHYNDDQDVYWWNYLKNSFRHFYELGRKGGRE